MSDNIFAALADPRRRQIVETLSVSGAGTATALAGDLGISRQATAKHLSILAAAGLVASARRGRETLYRPDLESLADVTAWISRVEGDWTHRLERLAGVVQKAEHDRIDESLP